MWQLCVCRVLDITTSVQSIKIRKGKEKHYIYVPPAVLCAV